MLSNSYAVTRVCLRRQLVESIGRKCDIPATNLTQTLIEESDKLLVQGILTYWRDDTHWNKYGIAAAADVVNKKMLLHN